MRVLIVEDDAALGLFLQKGLKLEGHDVSWVGMARRRWFMRGASSGSDCARPEPSEERRDGGAGGDARRFDETSVLVLTGRSHVESG